MKKEGKSAGKKEQKKETAILLLRTIRCFGIVLFVSSSMLSIYASKTFS